MAYVRNRRGPVDVAAPCQSEVAAVRIPIERAVDPFALDPVPAVAKPEAGTAISAILDKLHPLAVCNAAIGDAMRMEEGLVARPLAVERKTLTGCANFDQALLSFDPSRRLGCETGGRITLHVGRFERVL